MSHRAYPTLQRQPHGARRRTPQEARRHQFGDLVLPALMALLLERMERSPRPLPEKVLGHLLASAAANVGVVTARVGHPSESERPDAVDLTDHLYR